MPSKAHVCQVRCSETGEESGVRTETDKKKKDYTLTHRDFDQILHGIQNNSKRKTMSTLQITTPSSSEYREVDSEDCLSTNSEPMPDYDARHRRLKIYTIILSITTILFGLQSLYFWLRPADSCIPNHFKNGYETEWRWKPSLVY